MLANRRNLEKQKNRSLARGRDEKRESFMANEQSVSRYRKYGEEQPCWKVGIFKIRLPFIHYAWSIPEMVQALLCAQPAWVLSRS